MLPKNKKGDSNQPGRTNLQNKNQKGEKIMKITALTDQHGQLSLSWDEIADAASYEVKICNQDMSETYVDTTVSVPELTHVHLPQEAAGDTHENESEFHEKVNEAYKIVEEAHESQEIIIARAIISALGPECQQLETFDELITTTAAGIAPLSAGGTGSAPCGWTHTHNTSDITAGTLPINRGGTGATNAATAMRNIANTVLGAQIPSNLNVITATNGFVQSGHISLTQLRGLLDIADTPIGPNIPVGSVISAQIQLHQSDTMAMMLAMPNPPAFSQMIAPNSFANGSGVWISRMIGNQIEIPAGWLQFDGVRYAIRRTAPTGGWMAVSGRFNITNNNSWCPSWKWSQTPTTWQNAIERSMMCADLSAPSPLIRRFA